MMDQEPAPAPAAPGVRPAGFWRRVAASIIDGIIILGAVYLVGFFLWPDLLEAVSVVSEADGERLEIVSYELTTVGAVVTYIVSWAYWAFQESGPAQATLGKRALRIRVTGLDGARVSLLTASYRGWPGWIGVLFVLVEYLELAAGAVALIACLFVPFTRRKQGLHDMMARCLVVRRPPRGL